MEGSMHDTGILQEIATLRAQLAETEAAIARHGESDHQDAGAAAALAELEEARGFMETRLQRLESCCRTVGAC
jgi:hypothetical protein